GRIVGFGRLVLRRDCLGRVDIDDLSTTDRYCTRRQHSMLRVFGDHGAASDDKRNRAPALRAHREGAEKHGRTNKQTLHVAADSISATRRASSVSVRLVLPPFELSPF